MANFTLPSQQYSSGWTFSPSVTVPANHQSASMAIVVSSSDLTNAAAQIDLGVFYSRDSGATWKGYVTAGGWRGDGSYTRGPSIGMGGASLNALSGLLARIGMRLSVPMTLSGSGQVT